MRALARLRGVTLVVGSFLVWMLLLGTAVDAADCAVPNTPGAGGSCTVTCASGIANVAAYGVGAGVSLVCPSGASVGCGAGGAIDTPDVGLGCGAGATGSFSGSCECSAGGLLLTSARCFC
ncbi:MAG: hypothetical protein ACREQY_06430 [Candidatus Binatia bacterium]